MTPPSTNQVVTFGCRLNTYESEVITNLAKAHGVEDTIFVNTCAVTQEAERQARQTIRKLRRQAPHARIVVTGCAAQINPQSYADMPEVSAVWGNQEKMQASSYATLASPHADLPRISVQNIQEIQEMAQHLVHGFEGMVRAFVPVQNGCNHRCTFCNIPYGRGPSRSAPIGAIVEQVQSLSGTYPEVVFTGVDMTAYGEDLPGKPSLGAMVKRVLHHVPHLKRLRLSSLDPSEIDDQLWHAIENEPRLMPHLHLSVQAGDDLILKRMKRRHLRQHVIETCERAKRLCPNIVMGADIIAGFPTETDEQFQQTVKLVAEADLTLLHVFPYSPRPDTPAARMPQVDRHVIKQRAEELRQVGQKAMYTKMQSMVGRVQDVLIEQTQDGMSLGKTDHFLPVRVATGAQGVVPIRITGHQNGTLIGEVA